MEPPEGCEAQACAKRPSRPPTAASMAGTASRDSRLYKICSPYTGNMGPDWESIFEPAFRGGLGSQKDDYDNLQRHLRGGDIGEIPPSTAAQIAANAEPLPHVRHVGRCHDQGLGEDVVPTLHDQKDQGQMCLSNEFEEINLD